MAAAGECRALARSRSSNPICDLNKRLTLLKERERVWKGRRKNLLEVVG